MFKRQSDEYRESYEDKSETIKNRLDNVLSNESFSQFKNELGKKSVQNFFTNTVNVDYFFIKIFNKNQKYVEEFLKLDNLNLTNLIDNYYHKFQSLIDIYFKNYFYNAHVGKFYYI